MVDAAHLEINSLSLHIMICHSKHAIDPAPQDAIKTTRWNTFLNITRCYEQGAKHVPLTIVRMDSVEYSLTERHRGKPTAGVYGKGSGVPLYEPL
jgi:hypothetical protein